MTEEEFRIIQANQAASRSDVQTMPLTEPKKRRGRMNKLEQAYAGELAFLLNHGLIHWWDFEPIKFRLADGAWFCPDFAVLTKDGLQFREAKGFWREAARVRIKVAADKYPFRFVAVTKDRKTGEWQYEEIPGRATA